MAAIVSESRATSSGWVSSESAIPARVSRGRPRSSARAGLTSMKRPSSDVSAIPIGARSKAERNFSSASRRRSSASRAAVTSRVVPIQPVTSPRGPRRAAAYPLIWTAAPLTPQRRCSSEKSSPPATPASQAATAAARSPSTSAPVHPSPSASSRVCPVSSRHSSLNSANPWVTRTSRPLSFRASFTSWLPGRQIAPPAAPSPSRAAGRRACRGRGRRSRRRTPRGGRGAG